MRRQVETVAPTRCSAADLICGGSRDRDSGAVEQLERESLAVTETLHQSVRVSAARDEGGDADEYRCSDERVAGGQQRDWDRGDEQVARDDASPRGSVGELTGSGVEWRS
jgi:hypothetical protein